MWGTFFLLFYISLFLSCFLRSVQLKEGRHDDTHESGLFLLPNENATMDGSDDDDFLLLLSPFFFLLFSLAKGVPDAAGLDSVGWWLVVGESWSEGRQRILLGGGELI